MALSSSIFINITLFVLWLTVFAVIVAVVKAHNRIDDVRIDIRNAGIESSHAHDRINRMQSDIARCDKNLKQLEKASESGKGYKVTVTHTHGDTQVFEHVHEIGKCEGYIELIGKDGKAIALVADNFRTLVKEDE